ncbi:hypothetical protein ACF3OC_12790 [Sphingobacterium cellulitidis]|uniref:hypothetical protein n=1 Tax=Sphingobacterium cellulitidis TaxID=1768011 RepID=UPI00370D54FF
MHWVIQEFMLLHFDSDKVFEANIGRQMFFPTDLGVNKAISSITRINRFFRFDREAVPKNYNGKPSNFVITCTDNNSSRIQV